MNAIADEKGPLAQIKNIHPAEIRHASQYPIQMVSNEEFMLQMQKQRNMRASQVNEVPESRSRPSIHDLSAAADDKVVMDVMQKGTTRKTKTEIDKNFLTPFNSEQVGLKPPAEVLEKDSVSI